MHLTTKSLVMTAALLLLSGVTGCYVVVGPLQAE